MDQVISKCKQPLMCNLIKVDSENVINDTNVRKVIVRIEVLQPDDVPYKSWLGLLWNESSQDIINQYYCIFISNSIYVRTRLL